MALAGLPDDEQEQSLKAANEEVHCFFGGGVRRRGSRGRQGLGQAWDVLVKRAGHAHGKRKGGESNELCVTAQQALAMFLGHLGRSIAREHGENVSGP